MKCELWKFDLKELNTATKFYHENGFVGFDNVLNNDEVKQLDIAYNETVSTGTYREDIASPHNSNDAIFMHRLYEKFAKDRRILKIVADIFGTNNFDLQHTKFNAKHSQKGALLDVPWHQDFAYFPHSNPDLVAILIHFDNEDETTGSLEMIPKSHKWGVLSHCKDGKFKYSYTGEKDLNEEDKVLIKGKAGMVTAHHSLTLHYSKSNSNNDSKRRLLILQYRRCDAVQLSGVIWKSNGYQVSKYADYSKVRFFDNYTIENRNNGKMFDLYNKLSPDI
jgi:ectoine hydroxylase-related dioxygenase (phytanoyl-CoA dioxygenase family)